MVFGCRPVLAGDGASRVLAPLLEFLVLSACWSPDAGAHWAQGAILGSYLWWGGPSGPLGFPVSEEEEDDTGVFTQYFEYGEIWWHPDDGATIDVY